MDFQKNGNLLTGIHTLTIEEFENLFGYNEHRKMLIQGLKLGIKELQLCGCQEIYIDGSFVTEKEIPGDFDACWEENGMDIDKLIREFPTLVDFDNERERQKTVYSGEFFPARGGASPYDLYIDFFQSDKDGNAKGIIKILLK